MNWHAARAPFARAAVLGTIAVAAAARAGDAAAASPAPVAGASVEIVHFAGRSYAPVRVVRGPSWADGPSVRRDIVRFGNGSAQPMTIVRGPVEPAGDRDPARSPGEPSPARPAIERVDFAGPGAASVTVVRGIGEAGRLISADLFGVADAPALDRVAHAVHGVESSYGADPRMWRPEIEGPQGPMQVSAAAALDLGGGNRFDVLENRRLGRAYLARMFRRYGNWPDALAAYNWGLGKVDRWIADGRSAERLPPETTRYIERVLRNALIAPQTQRPSP
jgi:hypothetical protein